jgi:hypothetical protein
MPNFTQKHLSLILSALAVLVVAGIAAASFKTMSHTNVASNSSGPTTSGTSISGASGKSTATTGSNTGTSTTPAPRPGGGSYSQSAQTSASQGLYFSPTGTHLSTGQTLTVQIRENSGTSTVNAVQANFSYPANQLKFNGIDAGSSAFSIAAPSTGNSGKVSIARGSTTAISGDQLIATVSFTVLSGNGTASLAFTTGSALVTSTDHKNLVDTLGTAAYHLQ